jgi:hypothetical protein
MADAATHRQINGNQIPPRTVIRHGSGGIVTNYLGVVGRSFPRLCFSLGQPAAAILCCLFCASHLAAQSPYPILVSATPAVSPAASQDQQSGSPQAPAPQSAASTKPDPQAPGSSPAPSDPMQSDDGSEGQQTKRILGIVPNFQAVSANTQLPPLSVKGKFWLATEGTFDYSSFISVAMQAAIEQATNTYPEFHQGAAGYGRYYWHTFTDAGIENYFVGAILPSITHEDPRYYTLYRGSIFRRTCYALSRLWRTRNDAGAARFNFSEILGSGVATEISSRYYPRQERRGPDETLERWGSQMLNDGVGNVFQEFWPDINHKFFHRH